MKVKTLRPHYVDQIPLQLDEGKIYICEDFKLTAHLCCCGCKEEVYLKLGPAKWNLTKNVDGSITMFPSVGNWKYKCQSHYWITNNQVIEAAMMSNSEIQEVIFKDRKDRDSYILSTQTGGDPSKHFRFIEWIKKLINWIVGRKQ